MLERGARHLVLAGRKGAPAEASPALDELDRSGARVVRAGVDIADAEQAARLVQTIRNTLPPLRGVVHAAGVLDDSILLHQTWQRCSAVLAPKMAGAWNLHLLTRDAPLEFFVLYSSAASLLGSPGQASYAAANAFLDALAQHRRRLGLPGLSIQWGPWAGTGMAARAGRAGIGKIEPEDGFRILDRLLQQRNGQVAVLPADWNEIARSWPARVPSMFAGLLDRAPEASPPQTRSAFMDLAQTAPPAKRRELISNHLREHVARVLGVGSPDKISDEQGLFELGLDSLMAVELKTRLELSLGRQLPSAMVFDYPTIRALSGVLLEQLFPAAGATQSAPPAPSPDTSELLEDIRRLSENELNSLIDIELSSLMKNEAPQ
jgi:acyl carrier protein/NAD(P)-dependent dehydrogenase (short-subunit alcohol dehydrogenase family)